MFKRLKSYWPAVGWMIAIIYLSTTSSKSFPSSDWMDWFKLDKWIHALLYFVLFILSYLPYLNRKEGSKNAYWTFALAAVLLGVVLELVQAYVLVDRSGDVPDAIANTVGVILGFVFIRFTYKKWPWNLQNEGTVKLND